MYMTMPVKVEIKELRQRFTDGKLLPTFANCDYVDSRSKLSFTCLEAGHLSYISSLVLSASIRNNVKDNKCNVCGILSKGKHNILSVETARQRFIDSRLIPTFENTDYKNSKSELSYTCLEAGHKDYTSVSKLGHATHTGCRQCGIIASTKTRTTLFQTVWDAFILQKLIPLFKESDYINDETLLNFKCFNGHFHQINYKKVKIRGCGLCYSESLNGKTYYQSALKSYICDRINRQVKLNDYHWKDFYDEYEIYEVVDLILPFYNVRPKGMTVDHFIPCSFFDLSIKTELLACNDLRNLQYLTHSENSARHNNMTEDEIFIAVADTPDLLRIASKIPKKYHGLIKAVKNDLEKLKTRSKIKLAEYANKLEIIYAYPTKKGI